MIKPAGRLADRDEAWPVSIRWAARAKVRCFPRTSAKAVAAATVEAVAGRLPVIVHTGAMTTQPKPSSLLATPRSIGADAASVITPWYFMHSEAALEAHYRAVLERSPDFPVWLYNLPKFANNNLSAALVTRLARESRELRRV